MGREPAEIETEYAAAEAAILREYPKAAKLLGEMSRAFNEHAMTVREQHARIERMGRKLRGADRATEKGLVKIRQAAALRAQIAAGAVAALEALLPEAKKQAQKGKPALLRMILRASR